MKQPSGFKLPFQTSKKAPQWVAKPQWLYNPEAADALVLNSGQTDAVPVVVDPYICRRARPFATFTL